jgi:Protein of unknown function (DUF2971)
MGSAELNFTSEQIKSMSIFFPYAMERVFSAIQENQQFVHYCDATAALSMIENGYVWMRNAVWMNDESEIKYGTERLLESTNGPHGTRLWTFLDRLFPGFIAEFDEIFTSWLDVFQQDTYITCLTEMLADEDKIGRLSMWRAYGCGSAVALVINGGPFLRPSDALSAYSSPVAYLSPSPFASEFERIVDNIVSNEEFLTAMGKDAVFSQLFAAFRYSIVATKHPAFHEEREWRVIHQPEYEPSKRLIEDTKLISGNPQRIFKIPLQNFPDEGFYGATLPELLVRLIIGPGQDSENLRREFVRLLSNAGVSDATEKVTVSGVPLRV